LEALAQNRAQVLDRVAKACRAAGRDPREVRLVAVTKSAGPELAAELFALGSIDLGENRVDELERKATWFRGRGLSARWHFVGHLQRNKARRVLRLAHEIHAVDSRALLETLLRQAREEDARPGIYLQVKLAPEESKGGLAPDEVAELVRLARDARTLPLLGLMTIAPLLAEEGEARRAARATFEALAELARSLPTDAFAGGYPRLSMGMTGDLEEAIAAGAHVLRIGSALLAGAHGARA